MPYIPPEVVEKAAEMDLLTYLNSLKISNASGAGFSVGSAGKRRCVLTLNRRLKLFKRFR